ncbi:LPA1 [Auxenochlorella protothecoides x Auxenochlorella symbiontica]
MRLLGLPSCLANRTAWGTCHERHGTIHASLPAVPAPARRSPPSHPRRRPARSTTMIRSGPSPATLSVTSAKDAVEAGLQRFSDGDPATALQLFRAGLSMRPSPRRGRTPPRWRSVASASCRWCCRRTARRRSGWRG